MQRNSNCLDIQSGPKSKLLYCFFGPLCICRMNESPKIKSLVFTQCSICQKAVGVERWGGGVWQGCAPPHWGKNPWKGAIFPIPENFKIVHSGAISYTNFNVLFAIKCREGTSSRYSWRLTVIQKWKRQVFINLVNLSPSSQELLDAFVEERLLPTVKRTMTLKDKLPQYLSDFC